MLECLIMGDTIAVGIGQHRPECVTVAKVGINSWGWLKTQSLSLNEKYKVVVISLGTNDYRGMTEKALTDIRSRVKANAVVWILPSYSLKPVQRKIITQLANQYGDKIVDISETIGRDGIHPSNYEAAAAKTKI